MDKEYYLVCRARESSTSSSESTREHEGIEIEGNVHLPRAYLQVN
jgi:hypothetical protein